MQISKTFIRRTKDASLLALFHDHWNEHFFIRAWQVVGITVSADIFFLHPRKIFIEGMVEIFPVAISESHANAKEYNSLYAGVHAGIQQIFYVSAVSLINGRIGVSHTTVGIPASLHFIRTLMRSLVVETSGSIFLHKSSS